MRINVKLSDKQFDGLELSTKRELMRQLMLLDTPKYLYALGALGNYWTLVRYDRNESIGAGKWADDYKPELVDKWI